MCLLSGPLLVPPPFLFHLGIKPEGGVFETLGSLNVSATFRMPREVVGLKSTVVPGCLGGLAVFSELTVEFGCPRRPVAPSNREFPLP